MPSVDQQMRKRGLILVRVPQSPVRQAVPAHIADHINNCWPGEPLIFQRKVYGNAVLNAELTAEVRAAIQVAISVWNEVETLIAKHGESK